MLKSNRQNNFVCFMLLNEADDQKRDQWKGNGGGKWCLK